MSPGNLPNSTRNGCGARANTLRCLMSWRSIVPRTCQGTAGTGKLGARPRKCPRHRRARRLVVRGRWSACRCPGNGRAYGRPGFPLRNEGLVGADVGREPEHVRRPVGHDAGHEQHPSLVLGLHREQVVFRVVFLRVDVDQLMMASARQHEIGDVAGQRGCAFRIVPRASLAPAFRDIADHVRPIAEPAVRPSDSRPLLRASLRPPFLPFPTSPSS